METVVEENPLSLATSRIVTMALFMQACSQPLSGDLRLEFAPTLADTTAESETSVKFRIPVHGCGIHAGVLSVGVRATCAGREDGRSGYEFVKESGPGDRSQAIVRARGIGAKGRRSGGGRESIQGSAGGESAGGGGIRQP